MKKTTNEIMQELIVEISRYFPQEDVDHYKSLIEKAYEIDIDFSQISSKDKTQLESSSSDGSSIREQVDKILTFAEEHMSGVDRIKLTVGISSLLINHGELDLACDLAEEVERQSKANNYENLLAESYLQQSKVNWNQSEWRESKRFCKKAIYMFTELGDELGIANCENMFGTIAGEKGEIMEAKSHFERAANFADSSDADQFKAMLNTNLGIINDVQGNLEDALENYSSAEKTHLKLNDPRNLARLHHNMAMLFSKKKDYEKALNYFNKSIDVSIKKGYLTNCAISFIGKANIYAKTDKQNLSDAFVNKAVEISLKINDRLSVADAYRIKGIINQNLDNLELSEEYFENSLRLNDDFDCKSNIAETSVDMSNLYVELDENDKAEELKAKGEHYYESIN